MPKANDHRHTFRLLSRSFHYVSYVTIIFLLCIVRLGEFSFRTPVGILGATISSNQQGHKRARVHPRFLSTKQSKRRVTCSRRPAKINTNSRRSGPLSGVHSIQRGARDSVVDQKDPRGRLGPHTNTTGHTPSRIELPPSEALKSGNSSRKFPPPLSNLHKGTNKGPRYERKIGLPRWRPLPPSTTGAGPASRLDRPVRNIA